MRLLLDTNRYVDLVRGESDALDAVRAAREVFIPFIVLAELRGGFASGNRTKENEAVLTRILQEPNVSALYADAGTTYQYAAVFSQLRQKGTPIPTNDLWIAALAIQHELVLFSRDEHFRHVPQMARL